MTYPNELPDVDGIITRARLEETPQGAAASSPA